MAEASSSPEPSTAAAAQRRPAVLLCARESEAPGLHLSTYDKHWGIQPGRRGHSSPPLPPLNALLRGMPDRFLEGHPGGRICWKQCRNLQLYHVRPAFLRILFAVNHLEA